MDATIVNVALPTLGRKPGAGGLSALQWVVDGYTLTFAALQLIGGSLSDRLGARRAFAIGWGRSLRPRSCAAWRSRLACSSPRGSHRDWAPLTRTPRATGDLRHPGVPG